MKYKPSFFCIIQSRIHFKEIWKWFSKLKFQKNTIYMILQKFVHTREEKFLLKQHVVIAYPDH